MRNHKKLLLEQLERKLKPFRAIEQAQVPEKGWIHTIRTSLNMTLEQLGNKLSLTRQGARYLEERESNGSISLKKLQAVGDAFDMKLVYGFVPKAASVGALVDAKAKEIARKIVLRTHQNMKLEDQDNSDEQISKAINELANEIKREMRKSLWD